MLYYMNRIIVNVNNIFYVHYNRFLKISIKHLHTSSAVYIKAECSRHRTAAALYYKSGYYISILIRWKIV